MISNDIINIRRFTSNKGNGVIGFDNNNNMNIYFLDDTSKIDNILTYLIKFFNMNKNKNEVMKDIPVQTSVTKVEKVREGYSKETINDWPNTIKTIIEAEIKTTERNIADNKNMFNTDPGYYIGYWGWGSNVLYLYYDFVVNTVAKVIDYDYMISSNSILNKQYNGKDIMVGFIMHPLQITKKKKEDNTSLSTLDSKPYKATNTSEN